MAENNNNNNNNNNNDEGILVEDAENGYGSKRRIKPFTSPSGPSPWYVRMFYLLFCRETTTIHKNQKGNLATIFWDILGLHDLFSNKVWRASLAEVLGTASLVFAIDTIVISSYQTQTKTPNLLIASLIALTVSILLLATLPISGGHINPVITLAATFTGLISVSRATIYIFAQCLGAILGALALKAVVNSTVEQTFSLGGCTLSIVAPGPHGTVTTGIDLARAFWLEVICTFLFLFSCVWLAFDQRQAKPLGRVLVATIIGLVVGVIVFISTTVTATKGYAGAGMNPARCFGPAVVRGGHLWSGHWVFWIGPLVSCAAFALYTRIIPKAKPLEF